MLKIGDSVKIISTFAEADKPLIGKLCTIIAIYNSKKDIIIEGGHYLDSSTVVRKTDELDNAIKLDHANSLTIEYVLSKSGKLTAYVYREPKGEPFVVDVETLILKWINHYERYLNAE